MRALLLAAGLGTRLRPLTDRVPKCLVEVRGRPLLSYWLEMLFEADVESVLINLHYLPEKIRKFLSKSPYREKITAVYEPELLGTGGTLLKNRTFFDEDPLILIHADNFSVFSVKDFIQSHESRPDGCEITMMTFSTDTPESCGIVKLFENGVVESFYEKVADPPGNLANGAVYIVEPSVIEWLSTLDSDTIDFSTQVLPFFVGRIFTFHNNGYHRDIGTPESYQKAQELK